jgi:hypothetical protein
VTLTCEQCGAVYERRFRSLTCSRSCGALLREAKKDVRGSGPRDYPPEVVRQVCDLYAAGHTQREIQTIIGPGFSAQRMVERFVPQRRPAVKRYQEAEQNACWKGDEASYSGFHARVRRARGRASTCARCDVTTGPFYWANLTGNYGDVNDYASMCALCHAAYDWGRRGWTRENGPTTPPELRGLRPDAYEPSLEPPETTVRPERHGSTTAYRDGCRCEPCRAAQAVWWRSYSTRKGPRVRDGERRYFATGKETA